MEKEKRIGEKGRMNKLLVVIMILIMFMVRGVMSLEGSGGYDAPYFQADYIQDLSEWSSGIVNPALLYRVNQFRCELGMYRWGVDGDLSTSALGYQEASFLFPLRLNHTLGVSWIGTSASIKRTTIDANDLSNTIRDLGLSNFGDNWFIGHYSWRLMSWLVLGTNVKMRYQNQFDSTQQLGLGLDLGIYVNPLDHYRLGDLGISLNFQDIVPSIMLVKLSERASEQMGVSRLRCGIRYGILNDRLIMDGELVIDNALAEIWKWRMKADTLIRVGSLGDTVKEATYATLLDKAYRGSLHFRWQFIPQVWLKCGWSNNAIPYVGFNFNFIYLLPEMINYMNYDFHLGYSFLENERGFTMMHKISTDFGPTREQRESKRLYDMLILAPMDAYNEAMRLYLAGKYWEAAFAFGKVLSLYPNFYLNDKASYYMGDSYKRLYMNRAAREVFKSALEEYTTSEMRSKYLYGLESIDYREGKYDDALKNHAFIVNLYGESDIRPEADYIAGEVHFLRKNYSAAEQLLSRIKRGSMSYLYAQYTLAVINIENKRIDAAVENLRRIIEDTTSDAGVRMLQDAANVKLGHLYYEQVELRKAVEAYKRVSEGSSYGDEALLGISWSWIKVNQPAMGLQAIERLISMHPTSPLIPEAYLVRGYGLMLQRKFNEAVVSLEKCLEMCKGKFVTDADLAVRQEKFNKVLSEFEPIGDKIRKNALRKPTDRSIEERAGYKAEYDKFSKENREFFDYVLLAQSHKRFFMRKEQIISDAEYALAKATSMMKAAGQIREIEKSKKEEQKIDEEIEKLKKQLGK